jgi:hypothetical protein
MAQMFPLPKSAKKTSQPPFGTPQAVIATHYIAFSLPVFVLYFGWYGLELGMHKKKLIISRI